MSGVGAGVALPAMSIALPPPAALFPVPAIVPASLPQFAPVVSQSVTPVPAKPVPPPRVVAKAATHANGDVAGALLAVVAEKTGYPVSSLDLKLSLDADLGVDSIKRVEILSALQERLPHAPQVKPEHLGTLHTLQDVADFLAGKAPAGGPATTKVAVTTVTAPAVEPAAPTLSELSAPLTEPVSAIR